jgi:membrane associated rhomboid family serine protease
MSDKPWGILAVAALAAPICVACIAGPVVLASLFGSLAAWLSGTGGIATVLVGLLLGGVAALVVRERQRRRRSPEAPVDASQSLR